DRQRSSQRQQAENSGKDSVPTGGSGTVAGDELGAVLLLQGEGRIRLETAAAAGFVSAHRTNHDQFFAFDEALRVNGRIAAPHADGKQLGNLLGDGEEARHRFEWAAAIIGVQARDNDALTKVGELSADIDDFVAQELGFVDADDFRARGQLVHDFGGFAYVVRGNAEAGVRNNFIGGIAFVDGGLENLDRKSTRLNSSHGSISYAVFCL